MLYGCDPEVFLTRKGKPIGVHETGLPGTKSQPHKTSRGAVQQDGFAAEFNTDPVDQTDFNGFNLNIVKTLADLKELVPGCSIAKTPVMDFGMDYIESAPASAKILGCDPDYDAYTGKPNPRPNGELPFRSGAGHVHIGWGADIPVDNEEHIEICAGFVKMLDATVGMFMTFIDREPRRRELYGKAGAFRPKSYGVEYRTPSNAWIWNKDRRRVMHHMLNAAIQRQTAGYRPSTASGLSEEEIVRVINEGDYATAREVMAGYVPYGSPIMTAWHNVIEDMTKLDKEG